MQSWETWAAIRLQNRCIKALAQILRWKMPSPEGSSRSQVRIHSSQRLLGILYNAGHVSLTEILYCKLMQPTLFVLLSVSFSSIKEICERLSQTIYVPKHATAVIAHFFRLEKLIGFRWSPSSKSICNKDSDRVDNPDGGGKYTNVDIFLVLERFFYCTRSVVIMRILRIDLSIKAWIRLIFVRPRRQADLLIQARFPIILQRFNCEEHWSQRYLFFRVLLGMGVVHNLWQLNGYRRTIRGIFKYGCELSGPADREKEIPPPLSRWLPQIPILSTPNLAISVLRSRVYPWVLRQSIHKLKLYQLRFQMTNKIQSLWQYIGFALSLDRLCDTTMLFCFIRPAPLWCLHVRVLRSLKSCHVKLSCVCNRYLASKDDNHWCCFHP